MQLKDTHKKRAVTHVKKTKAKYKTGCEKQHGRLSAIREEIMRNKLIYDESHLYQGMSTTKVNFSKNIEDNIVARLMAKPMKFLASYKHPFAQIERSYKKINKEDLREWPIRIATYLNAVFATHELRKLQELVLRNLIRYGNAYVIPTFKVDFYSTMKNGKIQKEIKGERPEFEVVPVTNMFLDNRFKDVQKSPAVIRVHDKVTLSELYSVSDQLEKGVLENIEVHKDGGYKIHQPKSHQNDYKIVKEFSIDKFYGYFNPTIGSQKVDHKAEALYEIWTLNDTLCLKIQPIPQIPIKSVGLFNDTEDHYSVGLIEPIMGLERLYNLRSNQAQKLVNMGLNRNFIVGNTGSFTIADVNALNQPGGILVAQGSAIDAQQNIVEMPVPQINPDYFATQNEIVRNIQKLTYTIDTTATSSQQGFTNTATAVRARFYESNTMYAYILRKFENFFAELAYELLEQVYQHSSVDIFLNSSDQLQKDRRVFMKDAFGQAPLKYVIEVEMNSSSFEDIESKREDALAMLQVLTQAKQMEVPVKLNEGVKKVLESFERVNPEKLIEDQMVTDLESLMGQMQQQAGGQAAPRINPEKQTPRATGLDNPEQLTQDVALGNI